MRHQHFEELILADQPLSEDQQAALDRHLVECRQCTTLADGWLAISGHLTRPARVSPDLGFVNRWKDRLDQQRTRRARRQTWATIGLIGLALLMILVLLGSQVRLTYDSPAAFLVEVGVTVGEAFSTVNIVVEVFLFLSRAAPALLLAGVWVSFMMLSLVCLVWIVSLDRFIFERRVIKW